MEHFNQHHTITSLLQEATNVVNGTYDIEPLSTESHTAAKFATAHKAGKPTMKKSWKKPTDKPKRPLSAYNLFFQHERQKIITNNPEITLAETLHKISSTPKPKKRRHRKSHGMIGFADLARTIAEKWKALESSDKTIYESKAGEEKAKYKKLLEKWSKAREEKAKEDKNKSPLELARVEVVYDDRNPFGKQNSGFMQTPYHQQQQQQHNFIQQQHNFIQQQQQQLEQAKQQLLQLQQFQQQQQQQQQDPLKMSCQTMSPDMAQTGTSGRGNGLGTDSLSSLMMEASSAGGFRSNHGNHSGQQQPHNIQDYFKMTQQTIDMARASLSLPLFAGIGADQMNGSAGGASGNNGPINMDGNMGRQQMSSPQTTTPPVFDQNKFSSFNGSDLLLSTPPAPAAANNDPFQQGSLSASMLAAGMGRMG